MDIYDRLTKDHDRQRELLRKISETEGDSENRRRLFAALKEEADSHAAAEEQTFYAALIEKPDGQEKARHSIAEHKDANDLLEELDELDMGSGGWLQKLKKLRHELEHHVKEEEEEVFPLAKTLIDESRAQDLAKKFEARKRLEKST